ncbi:MAG TPA: helix-turn-helix domain-containing protein [Albitalea sp.]|uniref:helix-turn-helix domain-containing protein n=1 Tax=Piscinibacter sp. TaxID=1903157 RepID=UPI002ED29EF3
MTKVFNRVAVTRSWLTLVSYVGDLRTIETDSEYDHAVSILDAVLTATRGHEGHELESLIQVIGERIEAYESARIPSEEPALPSDVLRLLIESNGLTQADLAELVGGQPVVSAILNGKRQINARQASRLAERFGVSPALFIAAPVTKERAPSTAPAGGRTTKIVMDTMAFVKAFHKSKSTTEAPVRRTSMKYRHKATGSTAKRSRPIFISLHQDH